MANIKVAVRVRPISARELNLTGPEVVVRTDTSEIALTNLKVSSSKAGDSRERTRRYGFDYCFDSSDPEAENFADQARIYETLGQSVLDAVFSGYNSCLVAYGQSASGKTYTMMGTKEDPGLTPRLCEGLFSRIEDERKAEKTYCVSVSYLEIYNERVRDLLKPSSSTSGLRVREHPRLGPYVQGLTRHAVHTLGSLMSYVEEGTKARKTASTLQNPSSSRSHALLTIGLSAETPSVSVGASSGTCSSSRRSQASPHGGSKLRLVDLAGSESAATCSGVHRLKEGANINKSLVALGNVISALAERGSAGSGPGRRFIPYRDSSLTWLLKDALGGNATTIMLATISPARGSYNETAHTLRFAQRAQSVVNRPVVNEDPVARIIRELRAEVARLKSLLLEKNIEPETKAPCSCGKNQPAAQADTTENHRQDDAESSTERLLDPETKSPEADPRTEDKESRNIAGIRRSNSIESLTTCDTSSALRRFGSCEFLAPADRFSGNYNRAKVTELKDEEGEIHDAVFVDIPTLVAVLIKPDDSLQERSAQIEEICSDEVAEDSIDAEFIDTNDRQTFEDAEKPDSVDHDDRSSSVNSCHASGDNDLDIYSTSSPSRADRNSRPKEKPKFRKQDSMDVLTCSVPSNLHISKKYGSVEAIEKRKEPIFSLERSHTNLEKRSVVPDRAKKLNNIREIDDQKICIRNTWRNSKEQLQRKGSNDSDKSLKESNGLSKWKNYARKPSLDNLKRKTSKDSSSSSSKDEQILISSLARDKLLRRKSSLEQEPPSIRAHTPIQRAKRSEIVAAVTERLYSSRKPADEASGIRSPTEASDMKSMAKMKLQEISRKMLGKRRRICVDTQTDSSRTIRMRDTASLTDTPQVVLQDVGVLTEDHEACQDRQELKTPVLRVKEIATLTDKPKTSIVRCKDVASLANDLEEFEYDVHSPRHDSGILSDDTQNYAESNLSSTEVSDLCQEDRRVNYAESSTNTVIFSPCRSFAVQTPRIGTSDPQTAENKSSRCLRQCCNTVQEPQSSSSIEKVEKSVISISLPDTISITIESSNVIESRIAVTDNIDPPEEKLKSDVKNSEVQTDETNDLCKETICSKDFSRSTLSQTDNRVFRIENIFQDPNNLSKSSKADRTGRMRNSITFRNSLGTSYVSQPKEADATNVGASGIQSEGFIRDGLITEAFITKKRNYNLKKPSSIVYENPWRNWVVPGTLNKAASIDSAKGLGAVPSSWRHNETAMTDVTLPCSDCALENNSTFLKPQTKDSDPINAKGTSEMNSSALELHSNMDHDHSFSDDSLDYNENNLSESTMLKKTIDDHEQRENFCPPDVVAHTKKDSLKLSNIVDSENTESGGDFEGGHVEFPKKKPSKSADSSQIHDYKSLILGVQCYSFKDKDEGDSASNEVHNSGKKKVSFSSVPESQVTSKQPSRSTLKSIIKKRRKKNHQEPSNVVQSSNDETDDSQQEDKDSLVSENDDPEETPKDQGSTDVTRDSKQSSRKKVKFLEEANACSESDSCENAEEDDENVSFDGTTRNILEEYLSEAVTFMRNLNSINEYVNAANMLERCSTPSQPVRSVRRGQRRRTAPSARNRDYVELLGRRVSLQDAADYLQDTEDVTMPTESYERCLKGIERLEDCIRRVDRHNELLREKYGVNCESAGARPSLASPSSDPDVPVNDAAVPRGAFVEVSTVEDQVGPRLDPKSKKNGDDLEKRIFDQLMSVANSSRYRASNKLRTRFSKLPESRSPSNLRGEPFRTTEEPIYGDVHGVLNLGVPDEDLLKDFAGYQITGNLSVEKSMENGRLNPLNEDHLKLSHSSWCRDRTRLDDSSKTDDDSVSVCFGDSCDRNSSKIHFPSRSVFADKYEEPEDYSRQVRDDTKVCACLRDHSTAKSSMDVPRNDTVNFRDKLKYPGSPRARFLELLRERRRIVESSRGTSVS